MTEPREENYVVQPGRMTLSADYIHDTDADEIADFITAWFRRQIAPGIKREQDRLRSLTGGGDDD